MDKQEQYHLSACSVPLEQSETEPLLDALNVDQKEGMHMFVVGMRKLFKETLQGRVGLID